MKFVLRDLKVGMRLQAVVEEILSDNEVLMNFQGDLVRAANETSRPLHVGQTILVEVRTVAPLGFQLLPDGNLSRSAGRRLEVLA